MGPAGLRGLTTAPVVRQATSSAIVLIETTMATKTRAVIPIPMGFLAVATATITVMLLIRGNGKIAATNERITTAMVSHRLATAPASMPVLIKIMTAMHLPLVIATGAPVGIVMIKTPVSIQANQSAAETVRMTTVPGATHPVS